MSDVPPTSTLRFPARQSVESVGTSVGAAVVGADVCASVGGVGAGVGGVGARVQIQFRKSNAVPSAASDH